MEAFRVEKGVEERPARDERFATFAAQTNLFFALPGLGDALTCAAEACLVKSENGWAPGLHLKAIVAVD